jgi:hypothetical protein
VTARERLVALAAAFVPLDAGRVIGHAEGGGDLAARASALGSAPRTDRLAALARAVAVPARAPREVEVQLAGESTGVRRLAAQLFPEAHRRVQHPVATPPGVALVRRLLLERLVEGPETRS